MAHEDILVHDAGCLNKEFRDDIGGNNRNHRTILHKRFHNFEIVDALLFIRLIRYNDTLSHQNMGLEQAHCSEYGQDNG